MSRRALPLVIVGLGLLCSAVGLSYWQMAMAQARFEAQSRDTQVCQRLADDIAAIRDLPQFAVVEAEAVETLFGHIQRAAEAIPASALVQIQPSPPIQLVGSSYRTRPIRLELQAVTMEEIVTFAHHLVDENRGLTVRDLEFWQPAGSQAGGVERWRAQLTLTQLIFSPMRRAAE